METVYSLVAVRIFFTGDLVSRHFLISSSERDASFASCRKQHLDGDLIGNMR